MGNTLYMFAQASSGEDESIRNGLHGDQSGIELNCRPWFQNSPPWGKVYRFTDTETADKIATEMERLVSNGWVGYNSGQRESLHNQLNNVGRAWDKLTTPCATDCSALVYAAIYSVTGVAFDKQEDYPSEMNPEGKPMPYASPYVRNYDHYMEVQLPAAGYDIEVYTIPNPADWQEGKPCYTSSYDVDNRQHLTVSVLSDNLGLYLNDNGNLLRGDIVRTVTPKTGGHIAMWV